jgi:hypothetical protein
MPLSPLPPYLSRLPLRYDMILISVRAFFISSWVTFGLSLDVLTGFDSGVHWIGMAQVLRYVGPYIVLYFFLGMLGSNSSYSNSLCLGI